MSRIFIEGETFLIEKKMVARLTNLRVKVISLFFNISTDSMLP